MAQIYNSANVSLHVSMGARESITIEDCPDAVCPGKTLRGKLVVTDPANRISCVSLEAQGTRQWHPGKPLPHTGGRLMEKIVFHEARDVIVPDVNGDYTFEIYFPQGVPLTGVQHCDGQRETVSYFLKARGVTGAETEANVTKEIIVSRDI